MRVAAQSLNAVGEHTSKANRLQVFDKQVRRCVCVCVCSCTCVCAYLIRRFLQTQLFDLMAGQLGRALSVPRYVNGAYA